MSDQENLRSLLEVSAHKFREYKSSIADELSSSLGQVVVESVTGKPSTCQACDHLPKALYAEEDPAIDLIGKLAPTLSWRLPGRGRAPTNQVCQVAVVEIAGPDGMVYCDNCRFGLLLQSPDSLYPEHRHAAEELYLVLSGTAQWGTEQVDTELRPPGSLIHHAPWQPHAIRTLSTPLLVLWGWTGDLEFSTYAMR